MHAWEPGVAVQAAGWYPAAEALWLGWGWGKAGSEMPWKDAQGPQCPRRAHLRAGLPEECSWGAGQLSPARLQLRISKMVLF